MTLTSVQLLQSRYHILRPLGQGGMGATYQVSDSRLGGKIMALKELSDAALTSPQERAMAAAAFAREAQLLAHLDHPNIPKVTDFFTEMGKHCLVMEYVSGETLGSRLARQAAPVGETEARDWALQLCDVLTYLHSQNPPVIFRDLKPANIMLTPQGQIKLVDFGIARLFNPTKAGDTLVMGTPGYAPPEQYGKSQTDARADIYSLGVTLHEALTCYDPTGTPFKLPPARQLRPDLSSQLEAVILKATQLDPMQRYQTAAEMQAALTGHIAAPIVGIPQTARPHRWPVLAGVLLMVIVGVVIAEAMLSGGNRPVRAPVPVTQSGTKTTPAVITMGNVARLSELVRLPKRAQEVAFAPDGQTLAVAEADGIALWNLRTVSQAGFITTSMSSAVALSPDGRWLLTGSKDNSLQLWDVLSHNMLAGLEGHTAAVTDVAFDMTGRLAASSSEDNSVRVWDMMNHSELYRLVGHTDWVIGIAFSPNGGLLASAGRDALVQLWNAGSGTLVWSFRGHEGPVSSVAINPDGKLLASGSEDNTVRLWDLEKHTLVRTLTGHLGSVTAVAFSPDGRFLASSSKDGTVRLWETETGVELRTLKGHSGEILNMSFDPAGYWIASAGSDGVVILWGVK